MSRMSYRSYSWHMANDVPIKKDLQEAIPVPTPPEEDKAKPFESELAWHPQLDLMRAHNLEQSKQIDRLATQVKELTAENTKLGEEARRFANDYLIERCKRTDETKILRRQLDRERRRVIKLEDDLADATQRKVNLGSAYRRIETDLGKVRTYFGQKAFDEAVGKGDD